MDDADRTERLIRRNRDLLALAEEVRGMVRDAREHAMETCWAIQCARIERARPRQFRDQRAGMRWPPW
jgi:hypothetical protein